MPRTITNTGGTARLLGLVLLALARVADVGAEDKALRLATEGGYPPFSETAPDGSLRGLDIDIGNAICAAMKLQCVWIKVDWERMIPALISNKVDAIVASMTITEERKAKVAFTSKYYATPLALVGRSEEPLEPRPASLRGRKVGVERGTVADDFATRFWDGTGVEIIRYSLQDEAYVDLVAGRLDGVLTDYWQAYGGFLHRPEGRGYAVRGGKIHGRNAEERAVIGEGAGIAVRKGDQRLRRTLDQGLAAIRASGVYDEIIRRYFAEDIYGR
ncbi:MAG: transporter substrate-binding domain-containing protein [Gammaproteobacteria bacterium]